LGKHPTTVTSSIALPYVSLVSADWRNEGSTMETLKSGDLQTYKLGKSMLRSLVAHKGPADMGFLSCVL